MLGRLEKVPVYGGQSRLEEGSMASDAFKAQNVSRERTVVENTACEWRSWLSSPSILWQIFAPCGGFPMTPEERRFFLGLLTPTEAIFFFLAPKTKPGLPQSSVIYLASMGPSGNT